MITKKYKIPNIWNENTAKIIDEMFNEIYLEMQSKYHDIITSKPDDNEGKNGEIKFDSSNKKIYVKINNKWVEANLF